METPSKNPDIFQINNSSTARTLSHFNGERAYITIQTYDAHSLPVADCLKAIKEIKCASLLNSGQINIIAEIRTGSTKKLGEIVHGRISQIEGIARYEIHPVIG